MALLIWVRVAPALSVEQIVVRVGMPPGTPALRQSIIRVELMTVCTVCALVYAPRPTSRTKSISNFLHPIFVSRDQPAAHESATMTNRSLVEENSACLAEPQGGCQWAPALLAL